MNLQRGTEETLRKTKGIPEQQKQERILKQEKSWNAARGNPDTCKGEPIKHNTIWGTRKVQ